jgi:uncharacterized membrane protein
MFALRRSGRATARDREGLWAEAARHLLQFPFRRSPARSRIGQVPVAGLGALAYFGVFTLSVFAAFGYLRAQKLFAVLVWAMFAGTLWFLFVQAFLLHAFCRYCLFSAAIVFLLTGLVVATPGAGSSSFN